MIDWIVNNVVFPLVIIGVFVLIGLKFWNQIKQEWVGENNTKSKRKN